MLVNAQLDFDDTIINYKQVSYTVRVTSAANFPEEAVSKTRYIVRLYSAPILSDLTTYPITVGALTRTDTAPASGEFRIVDSINRSRPHLIEFNSAQAGNTYTITYYVLATVLDHNFFGFTTSGYINGKKMYVLNEKDHGSGLKNAIADLPSGSKVVFLKNGNYTLEAQLDLNTYSVVEMIGESTEGVVISCSLSSQNQLIINDKIIKNFTMTTSVSNGYGAIVASTALFNSTQKVQNIHLIGTGHVGYGFSQCANVSNCYATLFSSGFLDCSSMNNCYSYDNTYGYNVCYSISACYASENTDGDFKSCQYISCCRSTSAVLVAFLACQKVSQCQAINAGSYGFQNCRGMRNNVSSGAGTQNYDQTVGQENYSSHAVNATYIINNANGLDTVNGGFNT